MHLQGLNRWQAFAIHLGLSGIIFLALLAIFFFVWYPGALIHLGGWQGIKIVAAVDLVLGPVLTLIVFNPIKKSLKMDLSIIAIIQATCLSYGVWVVEQQRPMAQILLDDTLYTVTKAEYLENDTDLSIFDKFPGPSPKLVMLDLPNDHITIAQTLVKNSFSGTPLQLQTSLYLPIFNAKNDEKLNEKLQWRLNRLEYNETSNCYWLPVESMHFDDEICFSISSGAIDTRPSAHSSTGISLNSE